MRSSWRLLGVPILMKTPKLHHYKGILMAELQEVFRVVGHSVVFKEENRAIWNYAVWDFATTTFVTMG